MFISLYISLRYVSLFKNVYLRVYKYIYVGGALFLLDFIPLHTHF